MDIVLVIVVIGGIVGAIIYGVHVYEKKRSKAIEEVASKLGLDFSVTDSLDHLSRFSGHNLFRTGSGRKVFNVLSGETDEVTISIFDYQYTVGSGKQQNTPKQTVVALESPKLRCPAFSMRPENLFDKFGSMLGFQDIDFDNHPDFSRSFVLKGEDEAAIRAFFSNDLLSFFAQRPGVSVEAMNGQMIYYRSNKRLPGDQFQKLLEEAYQAFGMIVDRND